MAVTTKYTVDVSEFKKGMEDAQQSVKTFDAALKNNEAQLKKTGDAETYMEQKAVILSGQIEAQKKVVDSLKAALEGMQKEGKAGSREFDAMAERLLKAQTKLTNMETDLQNVGKESKNANTELTNIGKNVSWANVTEGLKTITDQLESGARAAINFGKKIARSAMDSTGWADDVLTRATQYGIDAETLQRMENAAEYIDTSVETIISAKDKMSKSRDSLSELLGISSDGRNVDDVFWEAGEAILNLGEGFDQNEYAMKIFGKSWRDLLPLFKAGREEYTQLLESQDVLSNENVERLGQADDAIKQVQQQVELMKNQFWADNADKITELLQWIIDNKDTLVAAVTAIGGAFAALKIGEFALNVGKVVDGFKQLGWIKGGAEAAAQSAGGAAAGGGFFAKVGAGLKTAAASGALTPLAVLGAGILPAVFAQNQNYANSEAVRQARLVAVSNSESVNAQFVREAAEALVMRGGQNKDNAAIEALLMGLADRQNQQKAELYNVLSGAKPTAGNNTWNLLNSYWNGAELDPYVVDELLQNITDAFASAEEAVQVPMEPEMDPNSAALIAQQIGTVTVPVSPSVISADGSNANGIWSVPYDGYLSILHKGERVVPARQVSSRNFSSNLYVESMYMNNGTDAAGLASAMAAAQRRTMNGFGS